MFLEGSWSYLGKVLGGQDAPQTAQDGAKTLQDGAKTAQDGAKTGQGGAKTPQNGAKTLQAGAETVQERQITKTLKNQWKNKVFLDVGARLEASWPRFGHSCWRSGGLLGTSWAFFVVSWKL